LRVLPVLGRRRLSDIDRVMLQEAGRPRSRRSRRAGSGSA